MGVIEMLTTPSTEYPDQGDWRTLRAVDTSAGYVVCETVSHAKGERLTHAVLRPVGITLILAGFAQWFLPGTLATDGSMRMGLVMMACLVGAGVSAYFLASPRAGSGGWFTSTF